MHYDDEVVFNNAILKVVFYKHTTETPNVYDYSLTSIQECRYVPPHLVRNFLTSCIEEKTYHLELVEKCLKDSPAEEYYIVELMMSSPDTLSVRSVTKFDIESSMYSMVGLH